MREKDEEENKEEEKGGFESLCVFHAYRCDKGQKRVSELLELTSLESTWVPCKSSKYSQVLNHLSSLKKVFWTKQV